MEEYLQEYKKAQRLVEQITQLVNTGSLNSIDRYRLEGQLKTYEQAMTEISERVNQIFRQWRDSPETYRITSAETQRRQNQFNDLINRQREITKQEGEPQGQQHIIDLPIVPEGVHGRDRLQMQKGSLQEQDHDIDRLIGTVGNIKSIGRNMNDELGEQNGLLSGLSSNLDVNLAKIEKTTGGLNNLVKQSSNCCLMTIIFGELLSLVFLVIFI